MSQAIKLAKNCGNKIIEDTFEEYWADKKDGLIRLHSSQNGFVAIAPKEYKGRTYTKVYYLVVDKEHRRKGIALDLLNSIKGDILYVTEVTNVEARALCIKAGFVEDYFIPNEFGGTDVYYTKDRTTNNGGPTHYYDFEEGWEGAGDVIEARNMNFNQGNMFKVAFCFNIGRHSATTYERELNKLIYFAQRELKRIKNGS